MDYADDLREQRDIAIRTRGEVVVSKLSLAMTFCRITETEIACGHLTTANTLLRKIRKTAENIRHHLQIPHHLPTELLNDIEKQLATLERRLGDLEAELLKLP